MVICSFNVMMINIISPTFYFYVGFMCFGLCMLVHRFVGGIKPGRNTGFDINDGDLHDMEQCRGVVVASAIFGTIFAILFLTVNIYHLFLIKLLILQETLML